MKNTVEIHLFGAQEVLEGQRPAILYAENPHFFLGFHLSDAKSCACEGYHMGERNVGTFWAQKPKFYC